MIENNKNKSGELPEEIEVLFEKKYDRDRLEEWKKKMPMPELKPVKKNGFRVWPIAAVILIIIVCLTLYKLSTPDPQEMALELIHNTQIASLSDSNLRGEPGNEASESIINFHTAITEMRSSDPNYEKATKLLSEVSENKNKYQIEAIWFKALAHINSGETTLGKIELEKLRSLSNYQQENVKKLISILDK